MKKNIGFVIDSKNDFEYILITNNHGKLKIKSKFLNKNFSALKNSFFIDYEFLDLIDDNIILNNNIYYKPDNLSINYFCANWTNKFNGIMSLIIFLCRHFIQEGICTKKILNDLLKLKNKNDLNNGLDCLINIIFSILQNSTDISHSLEKKMKESFYKKNKEILIIEFNNIFEKINYFNNKQLLLKLKNIIEFIIENEI